MKTLEYLVIDENGKEYGYYPLAWEADSKINDLFWDNGLFAYKTLVCTSK